MTARVLLAGLALALTVYGHAAGADYGGGAAMAGVRDADRAAQAWMLNCQGCHRPDGTGDGATAPALAGHVAVFTRLPGGRTYLGRVPGVATAPLSDSDLADLLNWVLQRFDPGHLAPEFKPYDAAEIAALRAHPLRTEAAATRAALLAAAPSR